MEMEKNRANLIEYIYIIGKWRKLIIGTFLIMSILTAAYSLCMPKTFTAGISILNPTDDEMGLGLSSLLSSLPLSGLGIQGISEATYTIIAILNSRTVMEAIANKYDLMTRYGVDDMEITVKALRENMEVILNEDLTIGLLTSASTPYFSSEEENNEARQIAKDMANSFIAELDRINKQLKTQKAGSQRIFIEKRYEQNLTDLKKAEEALRAYQKKYGIIALPEQTEATIQAAANLNAEIIAKEIEVAVMNKFVSGSHNELSKARRELSELKRKISEMKYGTGEKDQSDVKLFLPLDQAPDLGLQYVRLFREIALQQKILEFILPQYEQAKIQEARDTPTVQILDAAVLPIKRTSPKRSIMVLAAGFVAAILSIIFAFLLEYVRALETKRKGDYAKLLTVGQEIRGDVRRLLGRK